MQLFHSADIVPDESVAVVLFRVWWHFVVALKDKAASLFTEVSMLYCHIHKLWVQCLNCTLQLYVRLFVCWSVSQSVNQKWVYTAKFQQNGPRSWLLQVCMLESHVEASLQLYCIAAISLLIQTEGCSPCSWHIWHWRWKVDGS